MSSPWPCCCVPDLCGSYCTPGYPETLSVDLQGAADDQCSDWTQLDGVYSIGMHSCGIWQGFFDVSSLAMGMVTFGHTACVPEAQRLEVRVYLITGSNLAICFFGLRDGTSISGYEQHNFRTSVTLATDCCSWSGFAPAYHSRDKGFGTTDWGGDLSGATCNITASAGGC